MNTVFEPGLVPIQYALFNEAGELERNAMRAQIEFCLNFRPAGIATLGLATEVRDLTPADRRRIVEWNAEDIAGRTPLAVTIFEPTVAAEIASMRHAAAAGASWLIVQPPAEARNTAGVMSALSQVIEASPLPVAIQNAPQYIGVGLDVSAILELARRHPNLGAIKQEVSAVETADLLTRLDGRLRVYSGRGGLELTDCIAAGIHGHVPAPEYADLLGQIWDSAARGDHADATARYERVLPLATFVMQSLPALLTYGKLVLCARLGLACHQRNKAFVPTRFGLAALVRHCRGAGLTIGEADLSAAHPRSEK